MISSQAPITGRSLNNAKRLAVFLLAVCFLSLAGCGSTKVYTANKTITYKGDLYNMSNVQKISTRVEGRLPNGDVRNMKGMDSKAVGALLKEGSPILVTTAVDMDSQEMVYERRSITRSSEFSSMVKRMQSASKKISRFMANKKSTQLRLK
ncbi:MAG: hypothetical protein HKN57_07635 [Xanthomonadales bacterium]|nr:hypothetical protein [Gammaproteobacteria bacterium]MBT8052519.1 hypothetical protein [Gammaproteobacteria bacterium]NND57107.1 hypothetical protein [Xanthomonadales bacterium]NNK52757.1 hypothetical protein [Xanthomonadales bacterium]